MNKIFQILECDGNPWQRTTASSVLTTEAISKGNEAAPSWKLRHALGQKVVPDPKPYTRKPKYAKEDDPEEMEQMRQ